MYYPSAPPQSAPAKLSQKVHLPGGGVKWAKYSHRHKSIELEEYDQDKHKKGLADKKNKKVRKNHHGFVVHNGQVYHIDKGRAQHVRKLHAHEHERGKKHHHEYREHVEFHKEKKNVHNPVLDMLSSVIKSVKNKGRHRKDDPVPPFPDLSEYKLPTWFAKLGELRAEFNQGKGVFRGKGSDLTWPVALEASSIIPTEGTDLEKYRQFSREAGKMASALRSLIWSAERHRAISRPSREVALHVLNRHGLHQAGADVPEIDEAVSQLIQKGVPLKLTNREEQILVLARYINMKNWPLETTNEKGGKVPMSKTALYDRLKEQHVVEEKTLGELLNHPKTMDAIMSSARGLRRAVKNRERRAAKRAADPRPGASSASLPTESKASVSSAPSLVSMLYHR